MKRIINFLKKLFRKAELTAQEEQELVHKIIKKIKEN